MNLWKIIITPEAAEDIKDIYNYIARKLQAPETAKKQTGKILEEIHSLESMPMRYSLYEKEPWRSRGLRKASSGNFLIFYLTNEDINEVVILHVLYAGRNVEEMLTGNES